VAAPLFSLCDEDLSTYWVLPAFALSTNMSQNNLVQPVEAAATTQVKFCPYDEEEPHIWFRLIEAQFATAGIRSQKLKYANALASLPKQVLWDILNPVDVCNDSDQPFDH
jgi:phenylalanine-4-hydroxylase